MSEAVEAPVTPAPKGRLGDALLAQGVITADQLHVALLEQQRSGRKLGEVLVALGFVTEAALQEALSAKLGQQSVQLDQIVADPEALRRVPKSLAQRFLMFPLAYDAAAQQLLLASPTPGDIVAADMLRAQLGPGVRIEWALASAPEVTQAIERFYGFDFSIDGILREIETGEVDVTGLARSQQGYSHPIVRLVDVLLSDAVHRRASDLHLEPEGAFVRVRYRIDGVLRQVRTLHVRYWPAILVRVKLMSGMNIAENRAPQDGRCTLVVSGRTVDFRVSVQPTIHGENLVLRVLDAKRAIVPYRELGLWPEQYQLLDLMLARPEGVLLVTGPTGSGKTTTLYAILSHLNREGVNIMTLEDPVEYPLPRVRQTSTSDGTKIDFAGGIRSLMRQDPDIILVGEVRDPETAEMAFRAAMTGHQVFTTLHTNSALRSFSRLKNLGVLPDIMAGNIIGVQAQRLVRRLCPHCKEPITLNETVPEAAFFDGSAIGSTIFRAHPGGCERCDFQGYRGRFAIMELLRVDPGFDELLARDATLGELTAYAHAHGFVDMARDGLRRVLAGETSLEEVGRVVDLTGLLTAPR
ncbi:GspE/PulE family protein [Tepidimonas taiwanensis]|uniref:GspE/PulE family protein n=1 Tax=Tepidimonas taiwanensis TaxID=307486 RepID=UPI000734257B|nr:GspE/PulE family protein [Tepidimonas taiwanensis]